MDMPPQTPESLLAREVIVSNTAISKTVSRLARAGALHLIAPRVYTSNLRDDPAIIVRRNWLLILGGLFPGAVISHRSALPFQSPPDPEVFLTGDYKRRVDLPGLTVHLLPGPGPLSGDTPLQGGLYLASRPRALLENLAPSRTRSNGVRKTCEREDLESYLAHVLQSSGPQAVEDKLAQARPLAAPLGLASAMAQLESIAAALLGHGNAQVLRRPELAARRGRPVDSGRIHLLESLALTLRDMPMPNRAGHPVRQDAAVLENLAFFESYFSNYIEGTRFEVRDAHDIVFRGREMFARHQDSHDVRNTFALVSNTLEMDRLPAQPEALLRILRDRHAVMMGHRKDLLPGEFKQLRNQAGNTTFVDPGCVEGTLLAGYELYATLREPFARAVFMMCLVSEVHPFTDGNGRIARVMMNAELHHADQARIIIPTVLREDYILGLRAFSRHQDTQAIVRMLDRAQQFASDLSFNDFEQTVADLTTAKAFLEPSEGKLLAVKTNLTDWRARREARAEQEPPPASRPKP